MEFSMMNMLDSNILWQERIGRGVLGFVLIGMVLLFLAPVWLALLALYPLVTALIAWDPVYLLFAGFQKPEKEVKLIYKTPATPHILA